MIVTPSVRVPRLRVLYNGADVPALSAVVTQSGAFQADRFELEIAANASADYGPAFWSAEPAPVLLDVQGSLDGGTNWTSLILGQVDHIDYVAEHGCIRVDGRDLSARLIDAPPTGTYQNQTSSQIAESLAVRHGLIADVTRTETLVGRYYRTDRDFIGAGAFTRTTTDWNLLCVLAQTEGFDVAVAGTTLHFHPRATIGAGDPYLVTWDESTRQADALRLSLERSMVMRAARIRVEVRSWSSASGRAIYRSSGPAGQVFTFTRPNLNEELAQRLADAIRTDLASHEKTLKFTRPADLVLTPRTVVQLQGCGRFDGPYWPRSVQRRLSFDSGFAMSVIAKSIPPWLQT